MRKRSKLWLALLAVVMVLGQCLTVSAASNPYVQKVNSITVLNSETGKKVSSVAMVTNAGKNTMDVTLEWQWNAEDSTQHSAGVIVSTSNRAVVALPAETERKALTGTESVVKETKKYTTMKTVYTLKLTAVSNGSAKITIASTDGKKKATLNVKVTTLAEDIACSNTYTVDGKEYIDVAMNGSVNLGAAVTNSNATNKRLTYKVTTADDKKAVRVAGSGVVSVTNKYTTGTAAITITAQGAAKENPVTKVVYVNVKDATAKLVPVQDNTSTSAKTDVLGELNKRNTVSLKANRTSSAYTYTIKMTGVDNKDLVFVSNKPAVASVDANGKITAKANGSAVITVSYKNDSKKTAKINVKVTTDVEVMTVAAKSFTIVANGSATADIAAKVNAGASNKGVTYSIPQIIDENGHVISEKKEIAKYASVASNGKVRAKKPCIITVKATAKGDETISQAVTVTAIIPVNKVAIKEGTAVITKRAFTLKDNEAATFTLAAEVTGKTAEPTNKKVTWTSNKPAVASVDANGVVTVKAKGSAVITATAADGSKKSARITLTVKDERKASNPTADEKKAIAAYNKELAAVKKAVNASINTAMKEEVRDYTGFKMKFNASKGTFDVAINDPNVALDDLSNTGLASLIESLAKKHTLRKVSVTLDGVTHTATHKDGKVIIDGTTEFAFGDFKGAVNYIQNTYLADRPLTKNWNGANVVVEITVEQPNKEGKTTEYPVSYTMNFTMTAKIYQQAVVDTMAAELAKLNLTGVDKITVDGKTITVAALDADQDIKAADAADRQNVLNALNVIFADATNVTVSTNIPGTLGQTAVTKEKTADNSQADFINELADEYLDKVYAKATTYGALDGSVMVANVTYKAGSQTYTDTYTLYFLLDSASFDTAADKAIEEAIRDDYDFGTISYNKDTNAFAVNFVADYLDKDETALAGTGLKTVIESFLTSQNVDSVKVNNEKVDKTAEAICMKLAEGSKTLGALVGKTSTIEVTYKATTARKLVYTVSFNMTADTKADKAIAEAINPDGYDFGAVAYDAATNTLNVTIQGAQAGMTPSELTALTDTIQKAMDATGVAVVKMNGNVYEGKTAFDICTEEGKKYATIGELAGKATVVEVTYANGEVLTYTMNFAVVSEDAIDNAISTAIKAEGYDFGTVAYDAAANTLGVEITKDMAPAELAGSGLVTALQNVMDSQKVTKVELNGKVYTNATAAAICNEQAAKYEKLSDLDGKETTVKVTYAGYGTLTYTIKFEVKKETQPTTEAVEEITVDTVEDVVAEPVDDITEE